MAIDAYDALGLDVDANPGELKRAYRRMCLQHHPDKVAAAGAKGAAVKFQEIKQAYDILQDGDRRRVYDALGLDLGEERAEMQIWSVGVQFIVVPLATFTLKTAVAVAASWLLSAPWIKTLVISGGLVILLFCASDQIGLSSPEAAVGLLTLGVVEGMAVLHWFWPLLFDATCVLYLVTEVSGAAPLAQLSKRVLAAIMGGCLLVGLIVRNRWRWVLYTELFLLGLCVSSCAIAAGALYVFLDQAHTQYSDRVRKHRRLLRDERRRLQEEAQHWRQRLQAAQDAAPAPAQRRRAR